MLRQIKILILIFCIFPTANIFANSWRMLKPGLEYIDLSQTSLIPWGHIHAFRIDLARYSLNLVSSHELSQPNATVEQFVHQTHGLLAVNGGFFDQAYHSIGLRIQQKQKINPYKPISWWSIFWIKNHVPHITKKPLPDANVDFAIQAGPRLIINGKIPHLKPGIADRTALGFTRHQRVIVLTTHNTLITTTELAHILKSPPLNCIQALNLDGGSSTQLYAHIGLFHLNEPGFSNVSDAIVIKPL